jgi:hypothetical protein
VRPRGQPNKMRARGDFLILQLSLSPTTHLSPLYHLYSSNMVFKVAGAQIVLQRLGSHR